MSLIFFDIISLPLNDSVAKAIFSIALASCRYVAQSSSY